MLSINNNSPHGCYMERRKMRRRISTYISKCVCQLWYRYRRQNRVICRRENRSWASSNKSNDNRAVTIELANDMRGGNWHVSDKVLERCIDLCVDICKRNNINKLNFTGDASGNLTMHRYLQVLRVQVLIWQVNSTI